MLQYTLLCMDKRTIVTLIILQTLQFIIQALQLNGAEMMGRYLRVKVCHNKTKSSESRRNNSREPMQNVKDLSEK